MWLFGKAINIINCFFKLWKKFVLHTFSFCCCQSVTEVSQLVSITLVFPSEKMPVDRENWMVNWPIVTANMSAFKINPTNEGPRHARFNPICVIDSLQSKLISSSCGFYTQFTFYGSYDSLNTIKKFLCRPWHTQQFIEIMIVMIMIAVIMNL